MGRIEIELGADGAVARGPRADQPRVRHRQLLARPARGPHDFEQLAAAILADLGDRQTPSFRVSVRRADKRFPLTSPQIEREVGGLIKQATGWHVDLEQAGADDPHRDAADVCVLLLRQGAGRRRTADRDRRPAGVPAVGRHRLAGRRLSDDAARLLGAVRPLSQLSDPVARLAGEGARDRDAADAAISCDRG